MRTGEIRKSHLPSSTCSICNDSLWEIHFGTVCVMSSMQKLEYIHLATTPKLLHCPLLTLKAWLAQSWGHNTNHSKKVNIKSRLGWMDRTENTGLSHRRPMFVPM